MPQPVYALIDHNNQKISHASLETLAFAQELAAVTGSSLHTVILGSDTRTLAEKISIYSADSVICLDDPVLSSYGYEAYCEALSQLLQADQPSILLMAHSYQNIDMAPRLSTLLGASLVTDCIDYKISNGELLLVRKMFRAKLFADVRVNSEPPWLVTIQAGSRLVDSLQKGSSSVVQLPVDLASLDIRRRVGEFVDYAKDRVDLSQAETIVAVGRGVKKQESMELIRELAEVVGAEIGASRPIVDNGWLSRDRQIGSSGQTVSPKLYFAIGISGAIQHVVGIKGSHCIVAINSDRNAPIFNVAAYGILGDLEEVVPALTRRLREVL